MGGVQPNDKGMSIALDANGNIYSTGRFTGTVDFDPGIGVFNLVQTGGTYFMYISKLDKD
nr:hypothetical protein [Bacteroidota bacterium]